MNELLQLHAYRYPAASQAAPEDFYRPKLVLLHGMGGTGKLWRPLATALEDSVDMLCPDQRGHGKSKLEPSQAPFGPYDPLTMGADVQRLLENLDFRPTWLLGHSMGVRTALGLAKQFPKSVEGLILIDLGFTGLAGGGLGIRLRGYLESLPTEFDDHKIARQQLVENSPEPSIGLYLLAVLEKNPHSGKLEYPFRIADLIKILETANRSETHEWLRDFRKVNQSPVHLLRGEMSTVYSAKEFLADQELFKDLPELHWHTFEGATHGLPFEKRMELAQLVRTILIPAK